MSPLRHRRRRRPFPSLPLLAALFLLLSSSAISLPQHFDSSRGGGGGPRSREIVDDRTRMRILRAAGSGEDQLRRRVLKGLGSSPPTCRSKCGSCSPCTPVHVPIQPGFSMPLEYYPEAWRCKCGNKLFMP
ncbi:EPIDERMAL PATTERNING FACTOR-like protein 4 [Punica granatum]|uniref:Epidermal patterning factor-like protein n=2 Tax=Punica granatum TaxID=22663 RepID=A0A218WBS9_PUNGR|nr:EPIDERMAL PATTERNING FACTOR-like protein 4 [Punica granatum]OWM69800.1 hypothetical protein CDL15_Pgr025649 [Punica granatum]PKI48932.1 hypothetical protein CRG98_030665 [Punica granatum]